ncbi:hypothetical protein [Streptomyces sp. H27-C3]|uniref:hypothetical protein n=1 Tax=Streptomyces sp. H27-C3 TaxID=3046305 RepID=UPI0024B9E21C|nr:hypothetical protein [Streptomyces sp. H27-C3]MDJ0463109.1 hypothetical protein [Streptomyces sp. H27-C3]
MTLVRRLRELIPGHRYRDRIARRTMLMGEADIIEWADQGVTQLSRALAELRKSSGKPQLEEATDGLVVVAVVLEELERRHRL